VALISEIETMKHEKENSKKHNRHGAKFQRHLERICVSQAKRGFLFEVQQ